MRDSNTDMIPKPGHIYSLGEDLVQVLAVTTKGEVKLIYLNEIKTLDIKSFQQLATKI